MVERKKGAEEFSPADAIKEFENGLLIDKHGLDDELQRNEHTFAKVASAYALARSIRDHLKQRVKEEEAKAAIEFRDTARKNNEKHTVNEVAEAVILDEAVKELHAALINADRDCAILDGLQEAYKSRGSNIRKLADLHMSGYYDAGRTVGTNSKVAGSKARQAEDALRRQYDEEHPVRPDRAVRRRGD